jgi:O-antigen ligase
MKIITLNEKIKVVFNVLATLLIGTPVIFLFLIIDMLLHSLMCFQGPDFIETVRRFKILICILFYSIATIFIKNHKNEIKLCYLIRKMRRVKRK